MDAGSIPAASTKKPSDKLILMITYLINLKRAKDRRKSVSEYLKNADIEFTILEAVDGKQLSLPISSFNETRYKLLHGKRPNLGEIGCYLSHLKALELFIKTDENHALICEDDIEFLPNLRKIIDNALSSEIYFDLLRLSGGSDKKRERGSPIKLAKIQDGYHLAINFTFKPGTGCYLINKKGAKAVLKKLHKISLPIDHALDRDWLIGLKSLTVFPSPVTLKESLHIQNSYIQATKEYKINYFLRLWTVIPYRIFNESLRTLYKSFFLLKIMLKTKKL